MISIKRNFLVRDKGAFDDFDGIAGLGLVLFIVRSEFFEEITRFLYKGCVFMS